jgi:hypothetical protein
MKRKNFLKGAIGVAAAGTLLGGGKAMAQKKDAETCEKKLKGKNRFLAGWLAAWLGNMKKDLPAAEMVKVIEDNGRACAERGGSLAWAKSFNGDIDKFLAAMRKAIGANNARRDGSKITLIYEKCFCPLVGDTSEKLPAEYCLCTRGWTKAVYGAITGKEVKVDLKTTVKRGDPQCLIEVDLG